SAVALCPPEPLPALPEAPPVAPLAPPLAPVLTPAEPAEASEAPPAAPPDDAPPEPFPALPATLEAPPCEPSARRSSPDSEHAAAPNVRRTLAHRLSVDRLTTRERYASQSADRTTDEGPAVKSEVSLNGRISSGLIVYRIARAQRQF